MSIDDAIAELAVGQLGTFARFQVLALGGSDDLIHRRLRSGRWLRLRPGTYGLPGHRDTWDRRLWVVYLAAGELSVVSLAAAAACHRAPGYPRHELTVTVPHPQHQRVAGAVVHQSRYLPPHHWQVLWGRRTTTYARTLVDLAPTTSRARLDQAFQHGIVTQRLTVPRMAQTFSELLVPGRRGMAKLGAVLDERATGPVPPSSELERLLYETAEGVGLHLRRQFRLPGWEGIEGCVDAALPEAKLIMEADGRRWHTRVMDFNRDRARDRQAGRAGWQTQRFTWEELHGAAEQAADDMVQTYRVRLDLLRRAG